LASAGEPDSPYLRPALAGLMEAVTFHLSFDRQTMTPDMAEGDQYQPRLMGSQDRSSPRPEFAKGLIGQALVLGMGVGVYPRVGNVLLERRGALACWIRPEDWQRPNDGNVVFTMTSNASFYLEREGPRLGPDKRVIAHETVLYLAKQEGRMFTLADYSRWENGRWYLVVANWTWPTFELSVNGRPAPGPWPACPRKARSARWSSAMPAESGVA
jgi:hypothetical protein